MRTAEQQPADRNSGWLAILVCLLLSYPAGAETVSIADTVRYTRGDSPEWADPDFDDSGWKSYIHNHFPSSDWNGINWIRYRVEVDSAAALTPFYLYAFAIGATDIFLDGRLVSHSGVVGSSLEMETAAIRRTAVPVVFDPGRTRHLIAIRYSANILNTELWSAVRPNVTLSLLTPAEHARRFIESRRLDSIYQWVLAGIFFVIALVHLLLYFYHPQPSANLYFALFTLFAAVAVYAIFQPAFITSPDGFLLNQRIAVTGFSFMILFGTWFMYSIVYKAPPKLLYLFIALAVGFFCWGIIDPLTANGWVLPYTLLPLAEAFRILVIGARGERNQTLDGSNIIGIGAIPLSMTGVHQILLQLGLIPPAWSFTGIPLPFFAMLALVISMSIFLARNVARTNRNLKAQLDQITSLSEQTLKQELERADLEAENRRKSEELERARDIQLSMLPRKLPDHPDLEVAVYMETASEVGGDYYDFHLAEDGTLTAAIGDATGHGLHAGNMVAATKSLFNALSQEKSPASILPRVSAALKLMGFKQMYLGLAIAKYREGEFTISSGGMPFPLHYRAGDKSVTPIELRGMPMGSFPDFPYLEKTVQMSSGDTLLLLSDGLEEAFNKQLEMFGEERIIELLQRHAALSPVALVELLVSAGNQWMGSAPQRDDMTIVAIKRR